MVAGLNRKLVVAIAIPAVVALALGACGGKVCEKAAKQYTGCVEKILGKEAAQMAKSKQKEGIEACKKDDRTQKMYKKCLPHKDCKKFMDCITDYAKNHGP